MIVKHLINSTGLYICTEKSKGKIVNIFYFERNNTVYTVLDWKGLSKASVGIDTWEPYGLVKINSKTYRGLCR
jgi:hypothetical protein